MSFIVRDGMGGHHRGRLWKGEGVRNGGVKGVCWMNCGKVFRSKEGNSGTGISGGTGETEEYAGRAGMSDALGGGGFGSGMFALASV